MPIFLKAPSYDPKGCDGKGWNRIAIHGGMCLDECALKPKTLAAFLEAQDTRKASYGQYGACHNKGKCSDCAFAMQTKDWHFYDDEIFIRSDDRGMPWIMNRLDMGWDERGILTSWADLLKMDGVEFSRFADEFSSGVKAKRVAA